MLSFLIRLFLTAAVLVDRLQRRLDARALQRRSMAEAGQATAEYALVLLGAAAIALLLAAWAAKSGAIGKLFDAVVDQLISKVGVSRPRASAGQATVELVLALPVVVLALLLVIQVGLIARAQVLVVNAAREGARAAAVDGVAAARPDAARSPGIDDGRLAVSTSTESGETGDLIRVRVRYRVPTDVPLAGPLIGDPTLTAEVVMRAEDPSG